MTEKKLRYFIMVAECENISQAAGKLYIAQSALSKIIGGMEEELGYFLFDRIGKHIVLNQNGRIFYQYAKEIINNYDSMRTALSEENDIQAHKLCVGVCASSQMLSSLLRQFRKSRGNENDQIQIKASYPLDFMKDDIDILIDSDLEKTNERAREYLLTEEIKLAIPQGHPLEKKKKINMVDTMDYPYVLPEMNTGMGKILQQTFHDHGIEYPSNATVTNNSYVQCDLIAQGIGISFIPEKSWEYAKTLNQIVFRSIDDVQFQRNIYFQYHPSKYRSEIMKKFGEFLKISYRTIDA